MESKYKFTMCRLCLCENQSFFNIFDLNDWHGFIAAEVIYNLLRFNVSETDSFPQVVCYKCLVKLTDFKLFKESCQESIVKYDNMFVSRKNLEENKSEMDVGDVGSGLELCEGDPLTEAPSDEELIDSEVSGNEGIVESTAALMQESSQDNSVGKEVENDIGVNGEAWRVTGRVKGARERREGFKCYHCGIELMSKPGLIKHMKVHGFVNVEENIPEMDIGDVGSGLELCERDPLREEACDVTIKSEEVIIDSSSYEVSEDPVIETEVSCGPILLKYEVLPFSRGSHRQEELISSVGSGNKDNIKSTAVLMQESPQPVIKQEELVIDCTSGDETEEPFKGFNSEVELPLAEIVTHPKYPRCLRNKRPHFASKGEIVADSCTLSISTNDELILEKAENNSLREEVEASSSETAERLALQRLGSKLCLCAEHGKCFIESSNLKAHKRIHTGEKLHKCAECGKCFHGSSDLKKHMRVHTGYKPYKCEECSKCFSQSFNFKTHMRVHTGAKPYKCAECGKSFSANGNLKKHMRTHTGCKPYKCAECSKCFSQSTTLQTHMRVHIGVKPYKCAECNKSFRHSSTLKTHMMLHTGSKPYKCAECSKGFSQSSTLKTHMSIHTGSKPYKCAECSKCFRQRSTLKTHMRLHTGSKPYKCAECSKSFSQSSTLKKHRISHRL